MKQFIKTKLNNLKDGHLAFLIFCWGVGLPLLAFVLEGWLGIILGILGVLPWIVIPLYLSDSDYTDIR